MISKGPSYIWEKAANSRLMSRHEVVAWLSESKAVAYVQIFRRKTYMRGPFISIKAQNPSLSVLIEFNLLSKRDPYYTTGLSTEGLIKAMDSSSVSISQLPFAPVLLSFNWIIFGHRPWSHTGHLSQSNPWACNQTSC